MGRRDLLDTWARGSTWGYTTGTLGLVLAIEIIAKQVAINFLSKKCIKHFW